MRDFFLWLAASALFKAHQVSCLQVVLVKVGGSSITEKASKETLNTVALEWFSRTLSAESSPSFLATNVGAPSIDVVDQDECTISDGKAFVVVHGAGSYGHHTAKDFGLRGQTKPPGTPTSELSANEVRYAMEGLSKTRLSVKKLNEHVVESMIRNGLNAVGVSPCFGIRDFQAHGGDDEVLNNFHMLIKSILDKGLIPVLHGDACLYGSQGAGIISGDTLMEMLGKAPWASSAIFMTDVAGVFTKDPRVNPTAELIRWIAVDGETGLFDALDFDASGSTHDHDVTGGLKAKLVSAVTIAKAGTNVTIVKCESTSAEEALKGMGPVDGSTLIYRR